MKYSIAISKKVSQLKNNIKLDTLLLGVYITTLFFVVYNPSTVLFSEIIFILFAISVGIKGKIKFNPWIIAIILLAILSIISVWWAIIPQVALVRSKSIIQMTILFFLSYQSVKDERDVAFLLNAYLVGVFIMYGSILITYGIGGIVGALNSTYRLGLLVNEPNALGRYSAIAYVICLYKSLFNQDKRYHIIGLICIFMAFASGSRQALLILFIGMIIILYLNRKNRFFKLLSIFLVVSLFVILFPILAERFPIFERYNRLFALFFGKDYSDGSLLYRSVLIKYGFELFFDNPIIGYGTGQFVALSQAAFGVASASHNGFIEVLVSYGAIITVIYYSLFLRILKGLRKNMHEYMYSNLVFTIFIMLLISEVAHIGIYDKFTYVFLGIGLSLSTLKNRKSDIGDEK